MVMVASAATAGAVEFGFYVRTAVPWSTHVFVLFCLVCSPNSHRRIGVSTYVDVERLVAYL